MKCRICDHPETTLVENVQFYVDFSAPVFDCPSCGSRFAESQPALYETFHANGAHYYATRMRAWTDTAKELFDRKDVEGLRRQVGQFHFAMPYIIDAFEGAAAKDVLEVGCAWGYNSSYFLLAGYDLLGVDISATAVEQAAKAFGDHFCTIDDPRYGEQKKFDAIFHVGTIGCVDRPIEFTRMLLDKLKPGGVLVFNAPTRRPADQLDAPWIWGACPPDLVTLFSDSFWQQQFGAETEVRTKILDHDAASSLRIRRDRKRRRQPDRGRLLEPKSGKAAASTSALTAWKTHLKTVINVIAAPFVSPVANAFGVIVFMRKPS